jgi:hypothetical protein
LSVKHSFDSFQESHTLGPLFRSPGWPSFVLYPPSSCAIVYPAACCPGLYLYHNVTQEPIVLVCPFLEPLPGLRLESNRNSMFLLGTNSSCIALGILVWISCIPYYVVLAWCLHCYYSNTNHNKGEHK